MAELKRVATECGLDYDEMIRAMHQALKDIREEM